ncbi:hypothetical protein ACM9HF_03730 [Colwellia sp. RE-S-Sl-9]
MEHFNHLANEYYKLFYSYKFYFTKLWFNISLFLISTILFLSFSIDFFVTDHALIKIPNEEVKIEKFYGLVWILSTEALFLLSALALKQQRNKEIIAVVRKKKNSKKETVIELKKEWLLQEFKAKPTEYITLADMVLKSYDILKKHRQPLEFTRYDFYQVFYDESAKTRILSLLLAITSLIAVIILKNPNAIDFIFKEIYYTETKLIFFTIAFFSLFLLFTLIIIKCFFIGLMLLIESLFSINNTSSFNQYISNLLISDLIRYAELEINKTKSPHLYDLV